VLPVVLSELASGAHPSEPRHAVSRRPPSEKYPEHRHRRYRCARRSDDTPVDETDAHRGNAECSNPVASTCTQQCDRSARWEKGPRSDPDTNKRDRSDIGSLGCKLYWLSCQYRTCPAFPRRNQSAQQGVLIAPLACLDNHSPRPLFRRPLRGRDPVAEFLGARLRRHSVFPVHECIASHSWTSAMARSTLSCSQYSV